MYSIDLAAISIEKDLAINSSKARQKQNSKFPILSMDCYNLLVRQLELNNFDTFGFSLNDTALVSLLIPDHPNSSHGKEYKIESLVENQRGIKLFGIALFSSKSLIPLLDPSPYLRLNGRRVKLPYDSLDNYVLPDFDWKWTWSTWYVLMFNDADELGWLYLGVWGKRWHGKHRFGDCVRKRVWLRMRERCLSVMKSDPN